eukprot:gene13382-17944_t
MSASADEELDFRRDVDPNSIYELISLLGEGSYGAVYKAKARDSQLEQSDVAIKIIPDADDDLTTLWREIRFLQVLRSPYVVSFVESLLFDNELWLVMELCDGGSLYDLKEVKKDGFTEQQMKAIMAFSVLGLAHLHSQMSIHRDVKSGNILLTKDGKAKLGDFGISAQLTDTIMKRRTVIGSPYWMAPEVIQETSYDGKADIWSLGITLLELCEGSPPHFNVHPMRAIFIISSRPAPTLKEPDSWSPELNDFVSKCLVKDCDNRASARDLLKHPWIKKTVQQIGPQGKGLQVLEELIYEFGEEIEKSRFSKFKVPERIDNDANNNLDAGNGGVLPPLVAPINNDQLLNDAYFDENQILTINNASSFGIPATRQQVRNASLRLGSGEFRTTRSRSSSNTISPVGKTFIPVNNGSADSNGVRGRLFNHEKRLGKPVFDFKDSNDKDTLAQEKELYDITLPRGINIRAQGYDVDDDSMNSNMLSSSIVRSNNMNNNNNSFMRQNANDGSMLDSNEKNVKHGQSEMQAALKYFREEPLPVEKGRPGGGVVDFNKGSDRTKSTSPRNSVSPPAISRKLSANNMNLGSRSMDEFESMNLNNKNNNKTLHYTDIELEVADLDEENEKSMMQNAYIKQEILHQLSALKKQYRDDLEELTKSYESKRKLLKEALLEYSNLNYNNNISSNNTSMYNMMANNNATLVMKNNAANPSSRLNR